ncbi:MAG: FG-GAP-like repeat-containing protein [Thermoleophilia bacterium]
MIRLDDLRGQGFSMQGFGVGYQVAAAAGDVNGDGLADMLVRVRGGVDVVFGSRAATSINLSNLGTHGFTIDKATFMAPAGDLNGDGRDDVLLGTGSAPMDLFVNNLNSAFVLLGSTSRAPVDLANAADARLVRIQGPPNEDFGSAVAAPGDVNGDGIPDLVVGARAAAPNSAGAVYVVLGSRPLFPVDLTVTPDRAIRITPGVLPSTPRIGGVVAPAGDVNGDGLADIVIGAPDASPAGASEPNAGAAYVVTGSASTDPVVLQNLGMRGETLNGNGAGPSAHAGFSVAGGEDVNGDGQPDVVLGAPQASRPLGMEGGAAYVVQRWAPGQVLPLASLSQPRGFSVLAAADNDGTGGSVAMGDVNGDGHADIIIGSSGASDPLNPTSDAGRVSVVFGYGPAALAYPALHGRVGVPVSPLAPSTLRRSGVATFAAATPLPAGLSIDPDTGVISGTPRTATPAGTVTIAMGDLTGTTTAPVSVQVDASGGTAGAPAGTRRHARALTLVLDRHGDTIRISGTLVLPAVVACSGRVTVVARRGRRTVRTVHTRLRRSRRVCGYAVTLRSPLRPLSVTARFAGTTRVFPLGSRTRRA